MGKLRKFRYEALDQNGASVEGVEPARTTEEVIFRLLQRGLYPSRIESLTSLNGIAFERLEKFKELRDKLSPQEKLEAPPVATKPKSYDKYAIVSIIAFWVIILVVYLLCS